MGLHAGLGLIYQMKSVEPLVRKGDTVLLIPEYANFDGSFCFGEAELLMMVIDIIPAHRSLLSFRHWLHLLPMVPKYGADKLRHLFMPSSSKDCTDDFDAYGDMKYEAGLSPSAQMPISAAKALSASDFSPMVLGQMKEFVAVVRAHGGNVCVMPPAYQRSSFDRQKEFIACLSKALTDDDMPFVCPPERYALDDKYFYDTPYHLNLVGRIHRTMSICEDISSYGLAAGIAAGQSRDSNSP